MLNVRVPSECAKVFDRRRRAADAEVLATRRRRRPNHRGPRRQLQQSTHHLCVLRASPGRRQRRLHDAAVDGDDARADDEPRPGCR